MSYFASYSIIVIFCLLIIISKIISLAFFSYYNSNNDLHNKFELNMYRLEIERKKER
jgi:hypothetical protein